MAYAYVNTGEAAPQSYVLRMGDPHNRLDPVEPAVPYVMQAGFEFRRPRPGRRTAFANWLASHGQSADGARDGRTASGSSAWATGLVRTPNDFGTMGDKPDSHALLDWLAAEFMDARLEREGDGPADRDVERVPAVVGAG